MGTTEIRIRLDGISRQLVYQLTRRSGWPTPYNELAQGRVWRCEDVEGWTEEHRPHLEWANRGTSPEGGLVTNRCRWQGLRRRRVARRSDPPGPCRARRLSSVQSH
jgi:hypothetical protein